jgi:hypothetical protein
MTPLGSRKRAGRNGKYIGRARACYRKRRPSLFLNSTPVSAPRLAGWLAPFCPRSWRRSSAYPPLSHWNPVGREGRERGGTASQSLFLKRVEKNGVGARRGSPAGVLQLSDVHDADPGDSALGGFPRCIDPGSRLRRPQRPSETCASCSASGTGPGLAGGPGAPRGQLGTLVYG